MQQNGNRRLHRLSSVGIAGNPLVILRVASDLFSYNMQQGFLSMPQEDPDSQSLRGIQASRTEACPSSGKFRKCQSRERNEVLANWSLVACSSLPLHIKQIISTPVRRTSLPRPRLMPTCHRSRLSDATAINTIEDNQNHMHSPISHQPNPSSHAITKPTQ